MTYEDRYDRRPTDRRDDVREPDDVVPKGYHAIRVNGDDWTVRPSTEAAQSAVMFGTSKYAPVEVQRDSMMRFLTQHMTEESLSRLFERMSDPDDEQFGQSIEGLSDLFAAMIDSGDDERK